MDTHHALDITPARKQSVAASATGSGPEPERCDQNGHMAMSSRRLRICLAIIGWSDRELGRRTSEHRTTVSRWLSGMSPVPSHIAMRLERLVIAHEENAFPRRRAQHLAGELVA